MDSTSIHNYYEHLVIDYIQTKVIPETENKNDAFKMPFNFIFHFVRPTLYIKKTLLSDLGGYSKQVFYIYRSPNFLP